MTRITGTTLGLLLCVLTGLAGCSAEGGGESDGLDFDGESATLDASEPGEVEQSLDINIGLLPKQCCILGYRDGSHECGQMNAVKVVAKGVCDDAADDRNASSHTVKGGSCSKYEECPNYQPPPVSTPRPPGACPSGTRCCEPGINGTCDRCVDRDLICQ
jgi:hypothetical protein